MLEPQRRQNLPCHEVGEIVERLRPLVERRHRRKDHGARLGAQNHVLELRQAHRRFTRHDDERTALLEHHVGGALDQIPGETVRDTGERLHRAGHDRHPVRIVAAARDRRAEVPIAVDDERAGLDACPIARRQVVAEPVDRGLLPQLIAQEAAAEVRRDDLEPRPLFEERGDRPHRVDRAARAGDADHGRSHGSMLPVLDQEVRHDNPAARR